MALFSKDGRKLPGESPVSFDPPGGVLTDAPMREAGAPTTPYNRPEIVEWMPENPGMQRLLCYGKLRR